MLSFEQFRSKLADVVTVAINSGRRPKPPRGIIYPHDYCPLGCHPDAFSLSHRPSGSCASRLWNIDEDIAIGFARGFDGLTSNGFDQDAFDLGRLYRERFK